MDPSEGVKIGMPEGSRRGHPPIPPEKYKEFIDLIRAGNYIETACAVVGVSKASVYTKLKEGNSGKDEDAVAFLNAVKKAMAEAESRDVLLIGKAAEKNWTAAAWRLERKYDRWRRRDKMDIQGTLGVATHAATEEEMEFFKDNFAVFFPTLIGKVQDSPDLLPGEAESASIEDFLQKD